MPENLPVALAVVAAVTMTLIWIDRDVWLGLVLPQGRDDTAASGRGVESALDSEKEWVGADWAATCPLCGDPVPEDGGEPVWLDAPSPPGAERVQATVERASVRARVGAGPDIGGERILGKTGAELAAALRAIGKSDAAELSTFPRVREVHSVGSPDPHHAEAGGSGPDVTGFEEKVRDDKAGAELTVSVKPDEPQPDERMHVECFVSIFGGGGRAD